MPIVGVGVDLVDVARLGLVMRRTPSVSLRVFGEPADDLGTTGLQRLAARFAAKEAAAKALGVPGGIRWRDVEVESSPSGQPVLVVVGHTAEQARKAGVTRWHVSLSHDGGMAIAVVVAES